jgi:hypothetical protein
MSVVAALCLALTTGWLAAFWSLVVRAWIRTGEWPHAQHGNPISGPYQPSTIDPKAFGLHCSAVWIGLVALFWVVVPLTALVIGTRLLVPAIRIERGFLPWLLLTIVLVVATILMNAFGSFEWFMD